MWEHRPGLTQTTDHGRFEERDGAGQRPGAHKCKINEKCFAKCVTKPSTSLGSSEETCLSRCMDRYMEAFNVVSQSYVARISRERSSGDQI
ncbi:unnamed protein product [Rhizoctonia solani]|uniref:Mitochondrial import inner membrane translocase subunit n=1 Tax=Rhizoctonia solani TaxID=456999 RepID=A0A8H2WGW8_9AGAM|nr:unnamed protein product [Rhizoctonia solani]